MIPLEVAIAIELKDGRLDMNKYYKLTINVQRRSQKIAICL